MLNGDKKDSELEDKILDHLFLKAPTCGNCGRRVFEKCTQGNDNLKTNLASMNICEFCPHYSYQCDRNGDIAISYCSHPDNEQNVEGNNTIELCPLLKSMLETCSMYRK